VSDIVPCPGTLVCRRIQASEIYTIIACRKDSHPGPWHQLEMTLLRENRISHVSMEAGTFYNGWLIVHRP
jgi:hypothetical protein